MRGRLLLEKAALGFYLSGPLFDENAAEVRHFAKCRIADVKDSREPQLLAGIVSGLCFVTGQRGRVAIFQLDDQSETIEAVANDDLIEAHKALLVDDQLLIVQGKVQPDRFSGGLRLNVMQIWDLAAARARYGRFRAMALARCRALAQGGRAAIVYEQRGRGVSQCGGVSRAGAAPGPGRTSPGPPATARRSSARARQRPG